MEVVKLELKSVGLNRVVIKYLCVPTRTPDILSMSEKEKLPPCKKDTRRNTSGKKAGFL